MDAGPSGGHDTGPMCQICPAGPPGPAGGPGPQGPVSESFVPLILSKLMFIIFRFKVILVSLFVIYKPFDITTEKMETIDGMNNVSGGPGRMGTPGRPGVGVAKGQPGPPGQPGTGGGPGNRVVVIIS